jgi:hypothetical protein
MLRLKNVQHVKIYLLCYFEVNPIIHVGVIVLFSSKATSKLATNKAIYLKTKKINKSKMYF